VHVETKEIKKKRNENGPKKNKLLCRGRERKIGCFEAKRKQRCGGEVKVERN
jgi:hypothetical protein